jgi:hypothetical protein
LTCRQSSVTQLTRHPALLHAVVDGLPVITPEKLEKLSAVVFKLASRFGTIREGEQSNRDACQLCCCRMLCCTPLQPNTTSKHHQALRISLPAHTSP